MRKILIFNVVLSLLLCSCGSFKQVPEEQRRFERIINVPGKSKNTLYIKANAWFVETFNSAESVIEFQDKESGSIIGKYVFSYMPDLYVRNVRQTISIDIRNGKVRIRIKDPYIRGADGPYYPLTTQSGIDRARREWTGLANSLDSYLNSRDERW
jgi:hypothetical protein